MKDDGNGRSLVFGSPVQEAFTLNDDKWQMSSNPDCTNPTVLRASPRRRCWARPVKIYAAAAKKSSSGGQWNERVVTSENKPHWVLSIYAQWFLRQDLVRPRSGHGFWDMGYRQEILCRWLASIAFKAHCAMYCQLWETWSNVRSESEQEAHIWIMQPTKTWQSMARTPAGPQLLL